VECRRPFQSDQDVSERILRIVGSTTPHRDFRVPTHSVWATMTQDWSGPQHCFALTLAVRVLNPHVRWEQMGSADSTYLASPALSLLASPSLSLLAFGLEQRISTYVLSVINKVTYQSRRDRRRKERQFPDLKAHHANRRASMFRPTSSHQDRRSRH
jgi:hypothetical protein